MAMSIILIILFCYALGLKPLRLLQKIGKSFFTLIGLWIILMIVLCILGLIIG